MLLRPFLAAARCFGSLAREGTGASSNVYTDELVRRGFTVFRHSLPEDVTSRALDFVLRLQEEKSSSLRYKLGRIFDIVDSPKNRHSFPVPLSPEIKPILDHVCGADKSAKAMFQSLCGDDGPLVELSVLLTFPGAAPQGLHSDIPFGKLNDDPATGLPGLASVFVALHDINLNMGPTHVLEKTHLPSFHETVVVKKETYNSEGELEDMIVGDNDGGEGSTPSKRVVFTDEIIRDAAIECKGRDVYVMDSRCAHLGGGNKSERARAVLCFAFQRATDPKVPGFTYHIDPEVEGANATLRDFFPQGAGVGL